MYSQVSAWKWRHRSTARSRRSCDQKFGPDHVAIGTDVAYQSQNASREQAKVPKREKRPPEFRSLWPADDYKTSKEATDSVAWTNWPLFTVGLVQRGHRDEVIRKVIGGNVMRVARESISGS